MAEPPIHEQQTLGIQKTIQEAIGFHQQGNLREAERLYQAVLKAQPDHFDALHFLGILRAQQANSEAAVEFISLALERNPRSADAHSNLGNAFQELGRHNEAIASYDKALAIRPDFSDALYNRGAALQALNRRDEALASYDKALAIKPDHAQALNNRGNILHDLRRYDEAIACYDKALAIKPDYPEAVKNRGNSLMGQKRYEQASVDFERVLRIKPDYEYIRGDLLHSKMFCCDWRMFEREVALIEADLHAGRRSSEPFGFQAVSRSPHDLLLCSKIYANDQYPASPAPIWRGEKYTNKTIRVGYVSGEFRRQATSYLIAGLFELHDKSRFTLYAFDNGFDDSSPIRRRLERSFDVFFDISGKSDVEAARLIHDNQIDILVNLNGYFGFGRTGVFALKPCPVQVNYLGFPGTIGAEYIDYIIADRHVIREDEHQHYIEKVVYLPDSYQVNDSRRQIAERTPSRSEVGLPETGFVFCCFNNTFKLTPRLFDIWMRLLREIDASVLWLYQTNAAAVRNLRREAEQRGVASERLIFAPRVMLEDHLARHRLADLFLDTLPCNAHTTASDALWSGLPVVTSLGSAFPGRVAGSLLNAVGLPELITHSLEEYEALALKLATDGKLLAEIKARLAQNRATHSLFNTDRFRKHIEAAYTTMWERYQRGEPPASFAVEPLN